MAHDEHKQGAGHGDAHAEGGHKKHKKHHPHRHEEHEHEEGWIVSFADNVLLMMGFFVIMLAMNMGQKGTSDSAGSDSPSDRMLDLAIAVRAGFNNPLSLDSKDPADQALIRRMRERLSKGEVITPGPDGRDHSSQTLRPTDYFGNDGLVQFDQDSAALNEAGKLTIRQMAERITGKQWMVEVRAHSSRWESRRDPRRAHQLAHDRAYAVATELTRQGVKWEQLRLTSSGDAAPAVARSASAEQGRTNQRVEIMILQESMPADALSKPAP
jgi:flagellar motor protein MotB